VIVRNKADLEGSDRVTFADNWESHRLVLARDGQRFSFHETTLYAGTETRMWYRNHIEAVYCVGGTGTLEDLGTGEVHDVADGTMYLLSDHDRHVLRAETDLRMICVFDPALVGGETHDAEGAYPLLTDGAR
jgi:L-ectoine synthase